MSHLGECEPLRYRDWERQSICQILLRDPCCNTFLNNNRLCENIMWNKKQRHHFVDRGPSSQSYRFSSSYVRLWELDYKEGWAPKNWCFQTVVLGKTFESSLDSKEVKPVDLKGNQPSIFIGKTDAEAETPIRCPPDTKSRLIGKDPDAGKDWRQEKRTTEDEMVGWHHQFYGHEFEQTPGDGEG